MMWFCGGHGACLTGGGEAGHVERAVIAWMKRHLAGRRRRGHRPALRVAGRRRASGARRADYPLPAGQPIVAEGSGTLARQPGRRRLGHPDLRRPGGQRRLGDRAAARRRGPGGGRAVAVADLLGHRHARRTCSRRSSTQTRGVVVGNQVTPIPVTLDGAAAHRRPARWRAIAASLSPAVAAHAAGDRRQPGLRPGAQRRGASRSPRRGWSSRRSAPRARRRRRRRAARLAPLHVAAQLRDPPARAAARAAAAARARASRSAGKRVKVFRRGGRLRARVDLRGRPEPAGAREGRGAHDARQGAARHARLPDLRADAQEAAG